jgi:hypothetical protein
VKRVHGLILGSATALFLLSLLHPAAAFAQTLPGDPTALFTTMGMGWFQQLQGMAARLYGGLFTIEVIVVCVQGALYKDNIAEFFQGFAFKILMATVMLAVIGNAGTIFPAVVGMFETTAAQVTGNTGSTGNVCFQNSNPAADQTSSAQCTANTISNPTGLEANMLGWAAMYFVAADVSRAADSAEGAIAGIVVFGTGVPGLSTAFLMGHENFSLFCIAMGMTCVMSAAGLLLTYVLLTFETQVIMSIGVIFLAFQGSRFTAQFSQGYMSYCINIGTKFFVFYFMVSILGAMMQQGNAALGASIAGLIAGAAIPFGAGSIALVAASSPIPIICVISSVLIAAIPNFASSLLSGGSALSASAALQGGAVQSMAGGIGGGMSSLGGAAMSGAGKAMQGSGSQGGSRKPDTSTGTSGTPTPTVGSDIGTHGGAGGATDAPSTAASTPTEGNSLNPNGSSGGTGSPGATSTPANGYSNGVAGEAAVDAEVAATAMDSGLGPTEDAYAGNPVNGASPDAGNSGDGDGMDPNTDRDSEGEQDDNEDRAADDRQRVQDSIDEAVAQEAAQDRAAALNGQPPLASVQPSFSSGQPSVSSGQPSVSSGPPPVASGPPPAAVGKAPAAAGPPPAAVGKAPAAAGPPPAAVGKAPAAAGAPPVAAGQTPAAGGQMGATPRGSDSESTKSLRGVPTAKLSEMTPVEFKARMENTSFTDLNSSQVAFINSNPELREIASETFTNQAANNFVNGLATSAQKTDWAKQAASATPKGESPAPAVQVRVTNPDKL